MAKQEQRRITVATLNVHGWVDSTHHSNIVRVVDLLSQRLPDVLCLQEASLRTGHVPGGAPPLRYLCEQLSAASENRTYTGIHFGRCAIITHLPFSSLDENAEPIFFASTGMGHDDSRDSRTDRRIRQKGQGGNWKTRVRSVSALISPPGVSAFAVTCLHLDHRDEVRRANEVFALEDAHPFQNHGDSEIQIPPQFWCGDFNALTREDYTEREWGEIAAVRRRSRWEAPRSEVMQSLKERGFRDCWELTGRKGERTTCRFDTRIDYILASPVAHKTLQAVECAATVNDASDHNLVMATLLPR